MAAANPLNATEIKAFRDKVNDCFKELRKLRVKCRKNFSCCSSCGHSEMSIDGYEGSYVFYHSQTADCVRRGARDVYLCHNIAPEIKERVVEVVRRYGSDWDGDDNSTIRIPFNIPTPEEMAVLESENAERRERLRHLDELEAELGLQGGWDNVPALAEKLARYCISKNFYRGDNNGDNFHEIEGDELLVIRRTASPTARMDSANYVVGGYMFLDEDGGKEGCVRINCGQSEVYNPKWSFFMEGDRLHIDWA